MDFKFYFYIFANINTKINMKYTVYLRTNKVNGKQYVGQTNDFKHRESQWRNLTTYYSNAQLTNDRNKYGLENFEVEILAEVDTREDACELEVRYIKELNTLQPNGYNVATGGIKGFKYQEERNKKISEAIKGENNYWYGKKFSAEHCQKISNSNRGQKRSEEFRRHMSEIAKWRSMPKHTDEWKKYMSEIMTGRKMSKESIEKTSKSKWKAVIQEDSEGNIKRYDCLKQCGEYGYTKGKVSECCYFRYLREGNNEYKGSKWYWEEDYNKKLLEELTS